ncbi:MAG: sulfite exporter TauE/SafE family protein [Candidatus Methanomethylophilaceae archaeon]
MDPILILSLVLTGALAGILGALFGIGGGMIIVPILTIFFGMGARDAAAVSLVGIVATSVGASSVFVRKRLSNIRLGLYLETTTVAGAVIGAIIAGYLGDTVLLVIFSIVLIYSGIRMILNPERIIEPEDASVEHAFSYYDENEKKEIGYEVQNMRSGAAMCTLAGLVSSMTGVGGGSIKVPIMNLHMHIPMRAATATSNYMIGITAFAGAIIFFVTGALDLHFAGAVSAGGFLGSMIGTVLSAKTNSRHLRKYFSVLLFFISAIILLRAGGFM